ncbi:hypothetical protein E2320_016380, partial [Naja naja]
MLLDEYCSSIAFEKRKKTTVEKTVVSAVSRANDIHEQIYSFSFGCILNTDPWKYNGRKTIGEWKLNFH